MIVAPLNSVLALSNIKSSWKRTWNLLKIPKNWFSKNWVFENLSGMTWEKSRLRLIENQSPRWSSSEAIEAFFLGGASNKKSRWLRLKPRWGSIQLVKVFFLMPRKFFGRSWIFSDHLDMFFQITSLQKTSLFRFRNQAVPFFPVMNLPDRVSSRPWRIKCRLSNALPGGTKPGKGLLGRPIKLTVSLTGSYTFFCFFPPLGGHPPPKRENDEKNVLGWLSNQLEMSSIRNELN